LFYLGPPIGTGLSFFLASSILEIEAFNSDWRFTLRFTPFIVFIVLLLTIFLYKSPPARQVRTFAESIVRSRHFSRDVKKLATNKTYIYVVLATAMAISALVGFNWWTPTYIDYLITGSYNLDKSKVLNLKKTYSIVQTIAGIVGNIGSGELSAFFHKFRPSILEKDCFQLSGVLISCAVSHFVFLVGSSFDKYLDIFFYSIFTIFINGWRILLANILLDIVDPKLRSTANSLLLFTLHLLGDSLSPFWIGFISDTCYDYYTSDTINVNLSDNTKHIYCTQLSLYPLVYILFIGSSFALFSTLTFRRNKFK
jgi:sugar phosphate permease